MAHITTLSKVIILNMLLFIGGCNLNTIGLQKDKSIEGQWRYAKYLEYHPTKYGIEELNNLKKSRLIITKNRLYYKNIHFVDSCNDINWKCEPYDTSYSESIQLEHFYSKVELSKIYSFTPVDKTGEWQGCFADCAVFYLKQDTLINICGGYPIFLVRY